ncbi:MAG TPA: helix-turn-helix transcriptional regulator [Candidatus Mailhella merdigallinarum]|uniref:Helix-turn-helix transcriptional regulator n=1 Tax=Candidatus Mailhella merdigallinarum TaxID=2838658 RepID=A0A9D2HBS5_9BACT|nr:helix-turn-helix transcriptional regulator [Candidatus Mailhella merdigallinarum]
MDTNFEACPVKKTLVLISGKWNARVLYELVTQGSVRFGALRKSIPDISNTMLTATLRFLEEQGLVHREQFNEIPPHVEYSLSESGKALIPVFDAIGRWGETYLK